MILIIALPYFLMKTPVNNMAIDTLVFCTMVYDWYLIGCNNTILAPIIVAQCKDPVIIQLVNKYKSQIDIRIRQIVKIVVLPPRDGGGGDDNDTGKGNNSGSGSDDNNNTMFRIPLFDTCMCGPPGIDGCPPEGGFKLPSNDTDFILKKSTTPPPTKEELGGGNDNVTLPIPSDPCIENPSLPKCTTTTPQALISDPCIENPSAEGCETLPTPPPPPDEGDTDDKSDTDTGDGEDSSDSSDSNSGGSGGSSGSSGGNEPDSKGQDTVPE